MTIEYPSGSMNLSPKVVLDMLRENEVKILFLCKIIYALNIYLFKIIYKLVSIYEIIIYLYLLIFDK